MGEKVSGTERNMRPGHSHCQSTGSLNEAQATAMWGIGFEPQRRSEVYGSAALRGAKHQRKQHKEVVKEEEEGGEEERRSVKMGTKRREGRGGERLCLGVFFSQGIRRVTVPAVNVCVPQQCADCA